MSLADKVVDVLHCRVSIPSGFDMEAAARLLNGLMVRSSQQASGRVTNNAAERALRGIALGRKSWLFAGSERGGDRAAFMYTLIVTAKMNDIDPQAWMADVLARLPDMPISRVHELLPWHWKTAAELKRIAA